MFKNHEGCCAYAYQGKSSPVVSNFSMSTVDTAITRVVIIGNDFDLVEDEDLVTVTIAAHPCNITFLNATYIDCLVTSVPWGNYQPVVNLASCPSS
jgi:hypothetical protein